MSRNRVHRRLSFEMNKHQIAYPLQEALALDCEQGHYTALFAAQCLSRVRICSSIDNLEHSLRTQHMLLSIIEVTILQEVCRDIRIAQLSSTKEANLSNVTIAVYASLSSILVA